MRLYLDIAKKSFQRQVAYRGATLAGFVTNLFRIAFMPAWLQALCYLTPFPSVIDTPVRIYLNQAQGGEAAAQIAVQGAWALTLVVAGRLAAEAGRRKLTIQGG
ncbi:MAG TPA: hypothetical protein VJ793_00275 [Anaerolineae bacterium]|nr:hypothetical protein [Anaerolineae bacterium]